MDQIEIIIPVAIFEPLSIIRRSVDATRSLECGDMDVRIVYVLDLTSDNDVRLKFLEGLSTESVTVISRTNNRGRRAGAINNALESLESQGISPEYIALFDVDSRPHPNFLIECVGALRSNECSIIASSARFVTNEEESIVTRTIAAEYIFFSDVYRLFAKYDGFTHFNGLIGVLNAMLMSDNRFNRLNETGPCEDVEFTQNAYLSGLTGVFVPGTMVGEQAPCTISDLFNQRTRWLSGAYLGLRRHLQQFIPSKVTTTRKTAWFLTLSMPFVAFLMMPVVPLYGVRLWAKHGLGSAAVQTIGLVGYLWLITLCGVVVLVKQMSGDMVEWKDSIRSEV